MKWTESEIQALKSQEAKDLAVEFLRKLEGKGKNPLTAGEVQLEELQYSLKLKQAEAEDNRAREEHEVRIKELDLQIQQERSRQAESIRRADDVRTAQAKLLQQVHESTESLGVQLERATREHNLKIERLESEHTSRADQLKKQRDELEGQRDQLLAEINGLTDLRESAAEIGKLRDRLQSTQAASQQELKQFDEELASAEFERTKKINAIKRSQELEIAKLETEHHKKILQLSRKTAEDILNQLGMLAVAKDEWDKMSKAATAEATRDEQSAEHIRQHAREEVRKSYNITMPDTIDVTDLFYRHQIANRESETLRSQVEKLETEIKRMRQHIENEPQRIATAIEAAKVTIQNNIDQGSKR